MVGHAGLAGLAVAAGETVEGTGQTGLRLESYVTEVIALPALLAVGAVLA